MRFTTRSFGCALRRAVSADRLCGLVVRVPGYRSRGPGFDSRRYLLSTTEELLERKISGSGIENEITTVGIRRADHTTPLYYQTLALVSPAINGSSVGIVHSRTKTTELLISYQFADLFG
jgi:hypothetical protein